MIDSSQLSPFIIFESSGFDFDEEPVLLLQSISAIQILIAKKSGWTSVVLGLRNVEGLLTPLLTLPKIK